MGQVELCLGQADELDRPGCCLCDHKAHRIGHPDVLARQDDEPSSDEARALACIEEPNQPVETRIGV